MLTYPEPVLSPRSATRSQTALVCCKSGRPIQLVQRVALSGEGEVWRTQIPNQLAKIYHNPTPTRIRKLEVMVAHPPSDPSHYPEHRSFAWPSALLRNGEGQTVGFLMPEIDQSVDLLNVYNPSQRRRVLPGFDWRHLHATALNIASIVHSLHREGYVLGDMKPQNILVNRHALPCIIDTDSFQVTDPDSGVVYFCQVGSEGYTPPELFERDLNLTPQTLEQDRFRLGLIIYQLLMGDHPFKGQWTGSGDSPSPTELLRRGAWPYADLSRGDRLIPSPLTLPLDILHPALRDCMLRCFNQGHPHPHLRPSALEWAQALRLAMTELRTCKRSKHHVFGGHGFGSYGSGGQRCYWCDRKAALGVDIFGAAPSDYWGPDLLTTVVKTVKTVGKKMGKKAARSAVGQQAGQLAAAVLARQGGRTLRLEALLGQSVLPEALYRKAFASLNSGLNLPRSRAGWVPGGGPGRGAGPRASQPCQHRGHQSRSSLRRSTSAWFSSLATMGTMAALLIFLLSHAQINHTQQQLSVFPVVMLMGGIALASVLSSHQNSVQQGDRASR
jgi:hypothetical protein